MRNSLTAGSRLTSTAAIVAILMFSAVLVPAASAQPVDAPGHSLADYPSQTAPAPTHATATDGFDWGDAAIGAVAVLILLSVCVAGGATIRRSRGEHRPVLSA